MAFDAAGNYSPPDAVARMVHVVTKDHMAMIGRQPGQFSAKLAAGTVIKVASMGQTNVPSAPFYRQPQAGAAWIEHATANVGDVLPMTEVTPLVEAAAKKQAAVKAFWAKVAADRAAGKPG